MRREASLLAFVYGRAPLLAGGLRMIGAHTDSPCLKNQTPPGKTSQGYQQLGVEVYGGAAEPWFDRDLSIAGRVAAKPTVAPWSNRWWILSGPLRLSPVSLFT